MDNTAIDTEISSDSTHNLQLRLNDGLNPNYTFPGLKDTLLITSVRHNAKNCIKLLLNYKADVNLRNLEGKTATGIASGLGYFHLTAELDSVELPKITSIEKDDMFSLNSDKPTSNTLNRGTKGRKTTIITPQPQPTQTSKSPSQPQPQPQTVSTSNRPKIPQTTINHEITSINGSSITESDSVEKQPIPDSVRKLINTLSYCDLSGIKKHITGTYNSNDKLALTTYSLDIYQAVRYVKYDQVIQLLISEIPLNNIYLSFEEVKTYKLLQSKLQTLLKPVKHKNVVETLVSSIKSCKLNIFKDNLPFLTDKEKQMRGYELYVAVCSVKPGYYEHLMKIFIQHNIHVFPNMKFNQSDPIPSVAELENILTTLKPKYERIVSNCNMGIQVPVHNAYSYGKKDIYTGTGAGAGAGTTEYEKKCTGNQETNTGTSISTGAGTTEYEKLCSEDSDLKDEKLQIELMEYEQRELKVQEVKKNRVNKIKQLKKIEKEKREQREEHKRQFELEQQRQYQLEQQEHQQKLEKRRQRQLQRQHQQLQCELKEQEREHHLQQQRQYQLEEQREYHLQQQYQYQLEQQRQEQIKEQQRQHKLEQQRQEQIKEQQRQHKLEQQRQEQIKEQQRQHELEQQRQYQQELEYWQWEQELKYWQTYHQVNMIPQHKHNNVKSNTNNSNTDTGITGTSSWKTIIWAIAIITTGFLYYKYHSK